MEAPSANVNTSMPVPPTMFSSDVKAIVSPSVPALAMVSPRPMFQALSAVVLRIVSLPPAPSIVTVGIVTAPNVKAFAEPPPARVAASKPANTNVVPPTMRVEPVSVKFASADTLTVSSPTPPNVIVAVDPAEASFATLSRRMSGPRVPAIWMPPVAASALGADATTVVGEAVSTS